jgi:hypothetical protein
MDFRRLCRLRRRRPLRLSDRRRNPIEVVMASAKQKPDLCVLLAGETSRFPQTPSTVRVSSADAAGSRFRLGKLPFPPDPLHRSELKRGRSLRDGRYWVEPVTSGLSIRPKRSRQFARVRLSLQTDAFRFVAFAIRGCRRPIRPRSRPPCSSGIPATRSPLGPNRTLQVVRVRD